MLPISDNAFNAASHPAKANAARSRFMRIHWDAIADLVVESAPVCISFGAVGMKYAKVTILSRRAMTAAASHQCFREFPNSHAPAMLANVIRLSGPVGTDPHKRRTSSALRV